MTDPQAPPPTTAPGPVIVVVIASLAVGGAEGQLISMLEHVPARFASTRIRLLTLTAVKAPTLLRRCEAMGLQVDTIDRKRMGFAAFLVAMFRYFRGTRPDLVHTFLDGTPGTWGRLAARLAGEPVLVHSSRSLEPATSRLQRLVGSFLNPSTHAFLTNAEAIAARLRRQKIASDRIHVIPNGLDLDRFTPTGSSDLRSTLGIPSDAVVAGFLGGLRPVKRPDLLLDAVLALPESQRPDIVLFAGDGVLRPSLETRVASNPWLATHCRLLGRSDDAPAFLRAIDFLVLPSDTEGLPNVVIEALATERPCIATRVSDVPTLIGEGGIVVEPNDPTDLARAIGRMTIMPPTERKRLAVETAPRIRRTFDLEVVAERFWALHHRLLANVPGSGSAP